MEILIASDAFAPRISGVADTAHIVARTLVERGHRVRVLAPGPGAMRTDGYDIVRFPSLPFPLYADVRMTVPFASVARLLRERPPDAAVVLTPGPVGVAAVRALPARTRLVNIYTTDIPRYLRAYRLGALERPVVRLLRWMAARAAVTLCPTEHVRGELAARGFPRLAVWGRGVDLALFGPERRSAETRRRLTGGETEKPLVLYVGRLAKEKRLDDLHAAARRLSGVRFALVGDGPERDALERRFADVPAVFTGFLRGAPLAAAFASADIFAFPSDTDTFGQVVLQAMASGVPPIVPRGSAPAEFVPNGAAGLHFAPRSPEALAAAIAVLAGDEHLRTRLAHAARARAQRYSWPALVDRLEVMLGVPVPAVELAAVR
jgi:phosphatidylinositol alpha 1,6-mannosyltransferase